MSHGLDPWHREYSLNDAVALVADLARQPGVVAIGETGLDYFRTADADRRAQAIPSACTLSWRRISTCRCRSTIARRTPTAFEFFASAARSSARSSTGFSGDREMAELCAENGWYGSFGGTMTYPANEELREAPRLPAKPDPCRDRCPLPDPVPWRGHPNAPVAYTARYQAELLGIPLHEWCERIDTNTREVYVASRAPYWVAA